jgi:hypothetical protein
MEVKLGHGRQCRVRTVPCLEGLRFASKRQATGLADGEGRRTTVAGQRRIPTELRYHDDGSTS